MSKIPKLLENVRDNLLQEARKELFENGYQAINIRTVASKCGIAVGTFYNYFHSKEILTAYIVLEDWTHSINKMKQKTWHETNLLQGLEAIYEELLDFEKMYHDIFRNSGAVYSKYVSRERHRKLREQLEVPIRQVCEKAHYQIDDFMLSFLAENFLSASQEQITYEKLEGILRKLFV